MPQIPDEGTIVVPAEIFELAPEIPDMKSFMYPGAEFTTAQHLNKFSIFITFEIDSTSYYADRTLSINKIPITEDNLNNMDLSKYGFNGKVSDLAAIESLKQLTGTNVLDAMQESVDAIDNMEALKADPLNAAGCPVLTEEQEQEIIDQNLMQTEIMDLEGNVIKTVYTQLSEQPFVCPSSTDPNAEMTANILKNIQLPDSNNPLPPARPPVCHIPEGPYKALAEDALTTAEVHENVTTTDINALSANVQALVDEQVGLLSNTTDQNPDDAIDNVQEVVDILEPLPLVQYGIPILTINKELNIIIHVVNGELQILNFDKFIASIPGAQDLPNVPDGAESGLSEFLPSLKIDILDNPEARILPGIKYTMMYSRRYSTHTLQLQREYTDEIFTNEASTALDTGIFFLGTDKAGLKHFCGTFYDVHLSLDGYSNVREYNSRNLFMKEITGALAFYDFYSPGDDAKGKALSRIKYNKVYPYKNIMNAISMRGKWNLEDRLTNDYTFMNHGFIDDIFCKDFFMKKSFSISIWINKDRRLDLPEEFKYKKRQMIISDNINENFIWYDESTYELVIQFHGFEHKMFFNIIPQLWNYMTFRYSQEMQKFFIDIKVKRKDPDGILQTETYSESFDLDNTPEESNNKTFQLLNMLAEYIWDEKEHQNHFDCLCGPIILYDSFQTDTVVHANFENQSPVLQEYKYSGIGGTENI